MNEDNAAARLEAVEEIRTRLARRARWSLARHAAFGLVMGGLVAAWSLPGAWPLAIAGLCAVATALIVAYDRKKDGMFISGYQRGQTFPVTLIILAFSLSALLAGIYLRTRMGLVWAPALFGLATFTLSTKGSIIWEHRYSKQLGARYN